MNRRTFVLGGAALGLVAAGSGLFAVSRWMSALGSPAKLPRIGVVLTSQTANPEFYDAIRQGLRGLGWIEGQNINFEARSAEGQQDAFADLVADLLRLHVDVLVCGADAAVAAQRDRTTTPIVLIGADAVELGLVASLAHPGGNITGISRVSSQLSVKWLELLKELVPNTHRVALLVNMTAVSARFQLPAVDAAATDLDVELHRLEVSGADQLDSAFAEALENHVDGLIVLPGSIQNAHRARIATLAAGARLPAIYPQRQFAEAGGLLAYGENLPDLYRRSATYVDKILRGAKPADLPIEQPTKFDFVVNAKALQGLGMTLPPSLVPLVTEWIQ